MEQADSKARESTEKHAYLIPFIMRKTSDIFMKR